jgi:5-methylcytosine-specific restriction enzyme subunit McrC
MSIPIQNLYYLLLYAWDKLDEGTTVNVTGADYTSLANLFARVLSGGASHAIKRGLDRDYLSQTETLRGVRGKIELSSTAIQNLISQGVTVCSFDELSFNVLRNQVIKSTVRLLVNEQSVDERLKDALRKVYRVMSDVSLIALTGDVFHRVFRRQRTRYYDFLLSVCRIVWENLMVDPTTGRSVFKEFVRDETKMGKVFEQFVFNFFRLEQTSLHVDRRQIDWKLRAERTGDEQLLPQMKTDVVLSDAQSVLLIETKYTVHPHQEFFGTPKIRSDHLYQVLTYVTQLPTGKPVNGILLYASTGERFRHSYQLGEHFLTVLTLDLAKPWKEIRTDLLSLTSLLPQPRLQDSAVGL